MNVNRFGKIAVSAVCIFVMSMVFAGCGTGSDNPDVSGSNVTVGSGDMGSSGIDPNQKWELKLNTQNMESMAISAIEKEILDKITELSNGQIVITPYYSNTLLDAQNQYSGVAQGLADISLYVMDANAGTQVLTPIFSVPTKGTKPETTEMVKIAQQFFDDNPKMQEENEKNNVHVLSVSPMLPNMINTINKEIRKPADMKGMKIIGNARNLPLLNSGGSGLTMSISEWYTSLEKGVAQGAVAHYASAEAFGLLELLKVHVMFGETDFSGLGNSSDSYIMNLDVWNSLPSEYQDLLTEQFQSLAHAIRTNDQDTMGNIMKTCKDRGDTIVYMSNEELKEWDEPFAICLNAWLDQCEEAGYDRAECEAMFNDLQARIAAAN